MSDDNIRVTSLSGKLVRDNIKDETHHEKKRKNDVTGGQCLPADDDSGQDSFNKEPLDDPTVDEAIEQINQYVQNVQRDIHFSVDETTGKSVVKVLDSESKEVIRQIPSEVAINLAQNLQKHGQLIKLEV